MVKNANAKSGDQACCKLNRGCDAFWCIGFFSQQEPVIPTFLSLAD
jgi:hypothetical protein